MYLYRSILSAERTSESNLRSISAWPAGRDFVVMTFDYQSAALHDQHHFGAQILIMIRGRHREVAFTIARTISEIVLFPAEFQRPSSASM